jgi:ketosteroid isomerase-like protein
LIERRVSLRVPIAWVAILVGAVSAIALGGEPTASRAAVDDVLTAFHAAAADADGERYFSLFADDAVFLGTDANERWTIAEFRAFAEPFFSKGLGWTYVARERHVEIAPGGDVAWFDEILWNDTYGTCRGTGVLVSTDAGWRIAQYHLTIPIPNDLSRELTTRIKQRRTADH